MWWSPASQDRLFLSAISAIVIVGSVGGCGADAQPARRPVNRERTAIACSWAGDSGMMRSGVKTIASAGLATQPMPASPRDLASTGDRVVSLRKERVDWWRLMSPAADAVRSRATAHTNRAARRLWIAHRWIAGPSRRHPIALRQLRTQSRRPCVADVIDKPHPELSGVLPCSFIGTSHHLR